MTINSFRNHATKILHPLALILEKRRITANNLSILSLIFATLSIPMYYYSTNDHTYLFMAALFVFLNSFTDALDGTLARITKTEGPSGDFLDHIIDRYSDVFILCAIFFTGYASLKIGLIAVTGVLLTSYLGTQAQAVNAGRHYGGILGRADRLVIIILATIATALYSEKIFYYSILGWSMILIATTSHITAIQRIHHIWQALKKESEDITKLPKPYK
ncbi:CDP-alcohol phosphatidyltransferase family protein [Methanosarcinales archaeon]|nr:MAG: CDP-alcohol phosphatidyltransferase family protein [Methanosarcinales archaeon]RLG26017.1 MAG: CDP-alcohol phosphatidyltransferase family protein [Methanosarcinales archaeon]